MNWGMAFGIFVFGFGSGMAVEGFIIRILL
jgi:hypothetical protein